MLYFFTRGVTLIEKLIRGYQDDLKRQIEEVRREFQTSAWNKYKRKIPLNTPDLVRYNNKINELCNKWLEMEKKINSDY